MNDLKVVERGFVKRAEPIKQIVLPREATIGFINDFLIPALYRKGILVTNKKGRKEK